MKPTTVTRIHPGTPKSLAFLARRLRAGDLVAVPTETVYGLAADALNARACGKIYAAKGRPVNDPLIVHLGSVDDLDQVAVPNPAALLLAGAFWPGPLTLVLPKTKKVPKIVTAGLPSVAVRVPSHPLFLKLLAKTGAPLAAPSANPFGYVSPTRAEHVLEGLGGRIGHILDGGASRIGVESTIVDLRDPDHPKLLRPGAITQAQIEKVLGVAVQRGHAKSKGKTAQVAPGQLARHYSPRTPVILHEKFSRPDFKRSGPEEAWLCLVRPAGKSGAHVSWLSASGNLKQVARNLFGALRTLDRKGYRAIHVELAKGEGLALAINDRLARAASR